MCQLKEMTDAEKYFFHKLTLEVKNVLKESQYKRLTTGKGILYYTGRILPNQKKKHHRKNHTSKERLTNQNIFLYQL